MEKSLNTDISVLKSFGPRKPLRPTLPKVSSAGWPHGPAVAPAVSRVTPSVVWNQYPPAVRSPERRPLLTEPTLSGRHGPVSFDGRQLLRLGVQGSPPEKVVALVIAQPPMTRSAARPMFPAHLLPRPKGSEYVSVKMKTWLR